jgi:threonine aldolase
MRNDHYGREGFVTELEKEVAELLGKEAAVFMPSGTMAQPIALRLWADESGVKTVAFHPTCHLELHEHFGYRELHGLSARLLGDKDRLLTLEDLQNVREPISTLLIELPQREIGGRLPTWDELDAICREAKSRGTKLHLDGARLWECGPYYQRPYAEICAPFDSVYVSFYKILDGLPGAILAGPASFVQDARVWQRRQGGNLFQQSANAISAKIGIDRHLPKMASYVAKAAEVAEILAAMPGVQVVPEKPPTNMMHLHFQGEPETLLQRAMEIAQEDQVALIAYLTAEGKTEISIGQAALELSAEEIRRLFEKLLGSSS